MDFESSFRSAFVVTGSTQVRPPVTTLTFEKVFLVDWKITPTSLTYLFLPGSFYCGHNDYDFSFAVGTFNCGKLISHDLSYDV